MEAILNYWGRQLLDKTESALRMLKGRGISTDTYWRFLTEQKKGKEKREFAFGYVFRLYQDRRPHVVKTVFEQ